MNLVPLLLTEKIIMMVLTELFNLIMTEKFITMINLRDVQLFLMTLTKPLDIGKKLKEM